MAGTLSPQDERFAELVARDTGLELPVVRAWVQAENGPAGNPLNIGPGRDFGTVDEAARATVNLLRHPRYAAIMGAARGQSVDQQLDAITASPWDAGRYRGASDTPGALLRGAYAALYRVDAGGAGPARADVKPGSADDFQDGTPPVGTPGFLGVDPAGSIADVARWTLENTGKAFLHVALTLLALGLIFVGLNKTTGGVPGQAARTLVTRGRGRRTAVTDDIPF